MRRPRSGAEERGRGVWRLPQSPPLSRALAAYLTSALYAPYRYAVSNEPRQAMEWLAMIGTSEPTAFVKRTRRRQKAKRTMLNCVLLDGNDTLAGDNLATHLDCGAVHAAAAVTPAKGEERQHRRRARILPCAARRGVCCARTGAVVAARCQARMQPAQYMSCCPVTLSPSPRHAVDSR